MIWHLATLVAVGTSWWSLRRRQDLIQAQISLVFDVPLPD